MASSEMQALAARNDLAISGPGQSHEDTLATYSQRLVSSPRNAPDRSGLPDDALQASQAAGYSLGAHLGERAVISFFPVRELDRRGYHQVLDVVQQNGTIIGGWITFPGVLGGMGKLKHGG